MPFTNLFKLPGNFKNNLNRNIQPVFTKFGNSTSSFLQKPAGKVVLGLLVVAVISTGFGLNWYLTYKAKQNDKPNSNSTVLDETSLTASVEDLPFGAPLTLTDLGSNLQSLIFNGQTMAVAPGKYKLSTLVDQTDSTGVNGTGQPSSVLGVNEELSINRTENKKLKLSLKPLAIDENKDGSSSSAKPLSVKEIKPIAGLKLIQTTEQTNESSGLNQQSKPNSNSNISYPKIILPVNSNGSLTDSNQEKSAQASSVGTSAQGIVAIVQPGNSGSVATGYSLVDVSKLILPVSSNPSNNAAVGQTIGQASHASTPTGMVNQTPTSNTSVSNSSTVSSGDSLIISTPNEQVSLATNCSLGKISFDSSVSTLRYFKACNDTGQNGFYKYDLKSNKEDQILPTSEISNLIRTDIASDSSMVFTKPTGEFGLIQNGQAQTILPQAFYSAPTFSPDGKYLIVMDNYLSKQKTTDTSLSGQFALKVLVVPFQELLTKKDKAVFKEVGTTYYIPRDIDYNFDFIHFTDSSHFMAGDSSVIFSLNGDKPDTSLESTEPGRVFVASNSKKYRLYQNYLFNDQNQMVATNVSKVYQLTNNELYFKIGDFLFRLVNNQLVQAYSKPVSDAVPLKQGGMQLILSNGEIVITK